MVDYGFASPYLSAFRRPSTTLPVPDQFAHPPKPIAITDPAPGGGSMTPRDMSGSDFVRNYLEPEIPQGVYQRYFIDRNNLSGTDRRSQFMQANYGRAQQAYQNALLSTPDLRFSDFLRGWQGPQGDWLNMTASQRGMNVPTRTQVIRWG